MTVVNEQPVRLRADYGDECHGYHEETGEWRWYSALELFGAVTAPAGVILDLDDGDDQENYWWVRSPDGERIAFQSIDVEELTPSYTVIVWFAGGWGCGNSYNEAVANARKQGRFDPRKDFHSVIATTEPVINIVGSMYGIQWEWLDREGDSTRIYINDKEEWLSLTPASGAGSTRLNTSIPSSQRRSL